MNLSSEDPFLSESFNSVLENNLNLSDFEYFSEDENQLDIKYFENLLFNDTTTVDKYAELSEDISREILIASKLTSRKTENFKIQNQIF